MAKIHFTAEDIEQIKALYAENLSLRAIGERYHVSLTVVSRVLKENGVQPDPQRGGTVAAFDKAGVKRLKAWYAEGYSLQEIADMTHTSRSTVKRHLQIAGVTLRPRGNPMRNGKARNRHSPQEDQIEVIEWLYWGLGYSAADVALALDIGPTAVQKRMQRHGIPRRPPGGSVGRSMALTEEQRKHRGELLRQRWREGKMNPPVDA